MAKNDTTSHLPGTETKQVTVRHKGEGHRVHIPADHDGSRVKVEFPDGSTTYTEGWDPAERAIAGARPVVPCANCGTPQVLVSSEFVCSACGAQNRIELKSAGDSGEGSSRQSG